MRQARERLFFRKEGEQLVWQYGRFRPSGVKGMLRNGWREIKWMQEGKERG